MAARSDRFTASARQPISAGGIDEGKWRPMTNVSVVIASAWPTGTVSSAASSPGPSSRPSATDAGNAARKRAISANSSSPTLMLIALCDTRPRSLRWNETSRGSCSNLFCGNPPPGAVGGVQGGVHGVSAEARYRRHREAPVDNLRQTFSDCTRLNATCSFLDPTRTRCATPDRDHSYRVLHASSFLR